MIYERFKIDNPKELYNPKHSNQIFSLTSVSESKILTLVLKLKLKLTLIHEYNFCKFMGERIYYRTIPTSNNFIIILFIYPLQYFLFGLSVSILIIDL